MKIKIKKWWQPLNPNLFWTECGSIILECRRLYWGGMSDKKSFNYYKSPRWMCSVKLKELKPINGPIRISAELAKKDAENLVKKLLLDIRDGTRQIMDEYLVTKDD